MKYLRVYSTPDGESHFEDVEPSGVETIRDWGPDAPQVRVVETTFGVTSAIFSETSNLSENVHGWHCAPRRQFVVPLQGRARFDTSSGESREVGPGDVVLAEDLTGKGHRAVSLTPDFYTVCLPIDDRA